MAEFVFKMKPLPKPEYKLMKSLLNQLALDSPTELFAVSLRLLAEVQRYHPADSNLEANGEKFGVLWITQVIDSYRTRTEAERTAEYTP